MPTEVKDLLDFSGKTVVVTGASRGIGAGIVRRFGEAGANVVLHYRSGAGDARALVDEIQVGGGSCVSVQADLSGEDGMNSVVERAGEAFGTLDVMINNAGCYPNATLLEMTLEQWREMYRANADTAMLGTQSAARVMKDSGGGVIINMSSISALIPGAAHAHYNSAKAAVLSLTQSAAQELGPHNIRVNAVSPGLIGGPDIAETWPDGYARWMAKVPLGRVGTPEDVADVCLFLASPMARFVSGQQVVIDGGVTVSLIY